MKSFSDLDIEKLYSTIKENSFTIKKIKDIRFSYRATQLEFADIIGVKYNTYIRWENGSRYPSSAGCTLLQIAADYPEIFKKHNKSIIDKVRRELSLR